jgi:hypothetical protein
MPGLLDATDTTIRITYNSFLLATGGSTNPNDDPTLADPIDDLYAATDAGLYLLSAANDHTATIRIEWWDQTPPPTTDHPDRVSAQATTRLAHPEITLMGIDTGHTETIAAPYSGAVRADITCTGRNEADHRSRQDHDLFFTGIENWLIRFWPPDNPLVIHDGAGTESRER